MKKGDSVPNQNQPSPQVTTFLGRLATDPDLLVRFITNPDVLLTMEQFDLGDKEFIRNTVALEVAKKLVVHPAAYIHWGT
jgi:hypothetical protein